MIEDILHKRGGVDRRILVNYRVEDHGSLDRIKEGTNSDIVEFTFA
jgi:hypothetical protein